MRVVLPKQQELLQGAFLEWLVVPVSWIVPLVESHMLSSVVFWHCPENVGNIWLRVYTFSFCIRPCKLWRWSWWLAWALGSWSPSLANYLLHCPVHHWSIVCFPSGYMMPHGRLQEAMLSVQHMASRNGSQLGWFCAPVPTPPEIFGNIWGHLILS